MKLQKLTSNSQSLTNPSLVLYEMTLGQKWKRPMVARRWFLSSAPVVQRPIAALKGCSHVPWTWRKRGARLLKSRQWWAQGPSHGGGWQYAGWRCSEDARRGCTQEWAQERIDTGHVLYKVLSRPKNVPEVRFRFTSLSMPTTAPPNHT